MGIATARLLASCGASLSLSDIDESKLTSLKNSLGEPGAGKLYTTHLVDVSNASEVDAWIKEIVTRHGRLDGAVNLAGIADYFRDLIDTTDEQWARVLDINLNGTMFAMRAEIREMKKTGGGVIVNCASIAGQMGVPQMCPCSASKHTVIGLTKSAAREVGTDGIRVVALAPWVARILFARLTTFCYAKVDPKNAVRGPAPVKMWQPLHSIIAQYNFVDRQHGYTVTVKHSYTRDYTMKLADAV